MSELHVDGLKDLRKALKQAGPDSVKALQYGLRAGAEIVAQRAEQLAPVGTRPKPPGVPHLRDTIRAGTAGAYARVYSNAVYANPIHWGWPRRHIKPHPFIEEAIDDKQDEFVAAIDERLGALYRRLGL